VAPGKVYGQSDFKYVILKYFYHKLFNFVKFGKCGKILWNLQIKKKLYCTKRRCSQIKPQLKVKKEDGCEAPLNPSIV